MSFIIFFTTRLYQSFYFLWFISASETIWVIVMARGTEHWCNRVDIPQEKIAFTCLLLPVSLLAWCSSGGNSELISMNADTHHCCERTTYHSQKSRRSHLFHAANCICHCFDPAMYTHFSHLGTISCVLVCQNVCCCSGREHSSGEIYGQEFSRDLDFMIINRVYFEGVHVKMYRIIDQIVCRFMYLPAPHHFPYCCTHWL